MYIVICFRGHCLFLFQLNNINMNNNNTLSQIKLKPVVTYTNAYLDKFKIYEENIKKAGIYRWNILITGKSYVGSSINLNRRFYDYYSTIHLKKHKTSVIYKSLLKYGYSKFSLNIL